MIGLFSFDGPLYKDKNGVYCNVTLTNEMFERYFSVVDKLIILVRTFSTNETYIEMNMKPLTLPDIIIVEVGDLNTIKGFIIENKKLKRIIDIYIRKADMIFARMPSNISNSVLSMAEKLQKPYLVEVGGCAWDSYWNHGIMGKLIAPLMYYKEKKYVANANYSIYVTKMFLQHRYPNNQITTNCSNVYLQPVDNCVLERRLSKINFFDRNRVLFGQAVNSIDVKYKGEHLIIKAMGKLKKMGIMIEYQVVGPGEGDFLIAEAKKNGVFDQLKLVGTKTKEEMFKWYESIDVYVQPSKQEGLPRSVIEAMSTGCPALGSNLAGIPELLDRDCLFNPQKSNDIVNSIDKLLNVENLKKKATINFKKAEEYNLQEIEKRRQSIFFKYRNAVKG